MKKIFAFLVMLCSCTVNANDTQQNLDLLIESLTHCDADFFSHLYQNKNQLQAYTHLTSLGNNQAYIAVEDRTNNEKNVYWFTKPIQYHSIQLIGYYDSQLNLGSHGNYYFWGFITNSSLHEIRSSFSFLPWLEMEKEVLYTANEKIHYIDDGLSTWHNKTSAVTDVKTIPLQGTAEKLLLIEKNNDMTILACSLQGFFPPELLAAIRPDINNQRIKSLQLH